MKFTKKELMASAQVFRVMAQIFELFNKLGVSDSPGLTKSVLRTALFFAEEADLGRTPDPQTVTEMVAMDYREDCARKKSKTAKGRRK